MSTPEDVTTGRPLLLVISSDGSALDVVAGELERRYAPDYDVVRASSAQKASEVSGELALDGRTIALVLTSLTLSDSDGPEALAIVRARHPGALRVFLLQPGNREEAEMVQRPLQIATTGARR